MTTPTPSRAQLRAALAFNELGGDLDRAYRLSYAGLGASGASFGVFQADTAANEAAREVLRAILRDATMAPAAMTTILGVLGHPVTACPLSAEQARLVDAALASPQGRGKVDALDARTLDGIVAALATCEAAAAARGMTLAPEATLAMALWINMTGAPRQLNAWLGGKPLVLAGGGMLPPPSGDRIDRAHIEGYLRTQSFFRAHPRNFAHLQQAVEAGLEVEAE